MVKLITYLLKGTIRSNISMLNLVINFIILYFIIKQVISFIKHSLLGENPNIIKFIPNIPRLFYNNDYYEIFECRLSISQFIYSLFICILGCILFFIDGILYILFNSLVKTISSLINFFNNELHKHN